MSSKIDKLRENAQKLAIKGPVDKAIAAYEELVSLEPATLSHRQKLADLLIRGGRSDAARTELEFVGKNFSTNGFYLKAIAIYTRLQGLFPGDIPIALTLAELNEKHGLTANALAEYKRVYDSYVKTSEMEKALTILEKMQAIDAQNTSVRLKLAEAYFTAGKTDESYAAFGKLATLIQERGDAAAFGKLKVRIQQLFPQKSEFMLEVLSEQVASGNAASAVTGLQSLLRANPNDKRLWELIIEAYKQLDQPQKVKSGYEHFLKLFPDEIPAKAGLVLCLALEKDLKRALDLLDSCELELVAGGYLKELEDIYRILDGIDPINLRVLEGLRKVYEVGGKPDAVASLDTRIKSLWNGTEAKSPPPLQVKQQKPIAAPVSSVFQTAEVRDFDQVSFADVEEKIAVEIAVESAAVESHQGAEAPVDAAAMESPVEEEVEIEIDFDEEGEIEIDFDDEEELKIPLEAPAIVAVEEDWLEAVGKMLDKIATKTGKVKFASTLDGDDAQSHYDLGMAFMEMGLFDESFKEFRQATADTNRRFECFVFQSVCLRGKGDLENAEKVLRSLMQTGISLEQSCTVKYELALTCEVAGNTEEYVMLLSDIDSSDRNFRDVRSRLDASNTDKDDLDFSDDDFKGFGF